MQSINPNKALTTNCIGNSYDDQLSFVALVYPHCYALIQTCNIVQTNLLCKLPRTNQELARNHTHYVDF